MSVVRNELEKAVGKKWTKRIVVLCSVCLVYLSGNANGFE